MVSQDFRITTAGEFPANGTMARPQGSVSPSSLVSISPGTSAFPARSSEMRFLLAAVKRRWKGLLFATVAAATTAWFVAHNLYSTNAVTTGAVAYVGLPSPAGNNVYTPPRMRTYEQLFTSIDMLERLRKKRGLEIPAQTLTTMVVAQVSRDSSIMQAQLTWPVAKDATAVLNDLFDLFIQSVASDRRELLAQRLEHAQGELLLARQEVVSAESDLAIYQRRLREALEEDGELAGQADSLLASIQAYEMQIDLKKAEVEGLNAQIEELTRRIDRGKLLEVEQLVEALRREIDARMKPFQNSARLANKLRDLQKRLSNLHGSSLVTLRDAAPELESIAAELGLDLTYLRANGVSGIDDLHDLANRKTQIELMLLPQQSVITAYERRLQVAKSKLDELVDGNSELGSDTPGKLAKEVEAAESRLREHQSYVSGLRQLATCRVNELKVAMPASNVTTRVSNNFNKLLVVSFCGSLLVFCLPLISAEWIHSGKSPVVSLAQRIGVPLLAENLIREIRPREKIHQLPPSAHERLRSITLRIRQSTSRSGAIVLFSSTNPRTSLTRFVSEIAECLANREERVLVVDAVDPFRTKGKLDARTFATTSSQSESPMPPNGHHESSPSGNGTQPRCGLSEFLAGEICHASELTYPSPIPGIDVISSGSDAFPPEALASSRLTDLLDFCRSEYSIILVHSPSTKSATDLQMLAARADGIIFAVDNRSAVDSEKMRPIFDLLQLGAPVIGFVS